MTDVMKWERDKYYSFKTSLCISKPGIKIVKKKSHNLAPDFQVRIQCSIHNPWILASFCNLEGK